MCEDLREIFFKLTISLQCVKCVRIEHTAEGIRIGDCANAVRHLKAQPILGLMI
jgi:hypothetical protein